MHIKQTNLDIIIKTEFVTMSKCNQMNGDKQILSTKLSIEDYNAFLILTKVEYEAGLIKEESI